MSNPSTEDERPSRITPLGAAQDWLLRRLQSGHGEKCPLCDQTAKIYRRRINNRQARAIVILYRSHRKSWGHVPTLDPTLSGDGGMIAFLRYWGLVEELQEKRPDGGRAGFWRVTDLGEQFVLGRVSVPKYALIYNTQCLGLEGEGVMLDDCFSQRFDFDQLMSDSGFSYGRVLP